MSLQRIRQWQDERGLLLAGLIGFSGCLFAACGGDGVASATAGTGGSASSATAGSTSTGETSSCASASAETQTIVDAANAFLATLSATQLAGGQLPFTRPAASIAYNGSGGRLGEQYGSAIWSNYPASDIPRPGLPWGSLSADQQAAETKLLQVILSADGYTKVQQIMGSDQVLCAQGQNFTCGKDVYTIGIFGTPSTSAPWMVELGGHHLGLNVVINGAQGTVAPTLTGAQPAVYQDSNGTTVRVLAAENDKAFALLASLDATQSAKAITSTKIGDLVLGPGHENATLVPEGLQGSSLTEAQRAMLLDLITEWVGMISSAYACAHLDEIRSGLDDTYFLWSGPTTHDSGKNGSAYYRIQGPKVVIEFSPQGVGGDLTNHIHTVYRDPTNEYGHAW